MNHFFLLLGISFFLIAPSVTHAQTNNVTSQIENIGNPAKSRWTDNTACVYARNVWDMQVFTNRIYIGSGNAANAGPCTNAGPDDLWFFNLVSNQFSKDVSLNSNCGPNCIDEEQIDVLKVIGGKIYTPSRDPQEGWDLGNLYSTDGTIGWRKYRTIPNAIHVYDVAGFDEKLFVAIASNDSSVNGSAIFMSSDQGLTWTKSSMYWTPRSFFDFKGKFYAAISFAKNSGFNNDGIYTYTSPATFTVIANTKQTDIFPGNSFRVDNSGVMFRPTNFLNNLIYIGAEYTSNGSQMEPNGLYKITSISENGANAVKIALPNNSLPWDILVGQSGKVYVLGSVLNGSRYWVTVSSTSDLTNWVEEFRFDSPTFARSFEMVNNDFYFGLGTDTVTLSINSGDILRLKALASPTSSPNTEKVGDLVIPFGSIDIYDYNQFLLEFGKKNDSVTLSDLDNDDDVDIYDFNLLLSYFGN